MHAEVRVGAMAIVLIALTGAMPAQATTHRYASAPTSEAPASETQTTYDPALMASARAVMQEMRRWQARSWPQVEATIAAAKAAPATDTPAGVWRGTGVMLYLAPDGTAAQTVPLTDASDAALLWRWQRTADGLTLLQQRMMARPNATEFSEEEVRDFLSVFNEFFSSDLPPEQIMENIRAAYFPDDEEEEADPQATPALPLLALEVDDGSLLLNRQRLLWYAQQWNGSGPLRLSPMFWRAKAQDAGMAGLDEESSEYSLPDPLRPAVPEALRKLLRPQPIEARVVGRVGEEKTLAWSQHQATLELRLDRGTEDGLIEGMKLYGLPPDETLFADVIRTGAHESIAVLRVSRFSPDDIVPLPGKGVMFSTRRHDALKCTTATTAAVRARITQIIVPEGGVALDEDGYGFVELVIDAGSASGLKTGDMLYLEQDNALPNAPRGAARVQRVDAGQAYVLWRTRDWQQHWRSQYPQVENTAPAEPLALPETGQHLVTRAWQQAEREVFDSNKRP